MYILIQDLLNPFFLFYVLLAIAVVDLWWNRRLSRVRLLCLTISFVLLGAVCTPAVAYLALGSLEWRYPPRWQRPEDAEMMVVLGGDLFPPDRYRLEPQLGPSTYCRCLKVATLYHQSSPCPIVLSGGHTPDHPDHALADVMHDFMLAQGVAESDLILENRSTTTYENAVQVRKLLRTTGGRRIVLVTDAAHLLRAERCFVAQGFDVVPIGCHYRATHFTWKIQSFLPNPRAPAAVAGVAHEWIGVLWYRMCGRL